MFHGVVLVHEASRGNSHCVSLITTLVVECGVVCSWGDTVVVGIGGFIDIKISIPTMGTAKTKPIATIDSQINRRSLKEYLRTGFLLSVPTENEPTPPLLVSNSCVELVTSVCEKLTPISPVWIPFVVSRKREILYVYAFDFNPF